MPAASTASVYGDGPPGSQPVTIAPATGGQDGGRARTGTGDADDVDPLPGPDRPRGSAPARAPRPIERRHSPTRSRRELQRRRSAVELVRDTVAGPDVATDVRAARVGDPDVGEPDRFRVGPAIRPGDAGHRHREVRAEPRPDPSAMAMATWADTAPCAARTSAGTPARSRFTSSA